MGALLSTPRGILNALLPFTNPSTPILQDLIHTAILFLTLYYGPQLVEYYNDNLRAPRPLHAPTSPIPADPTLDDPPIDENLVLQEESDEEGERDAELPPLAPTPPPGGPGLAQPPPPQRLADWQNQGNANGFAEPGPAGGAVPRPTAANRTIGAKKAKSLARKDERRAYHEFHRQEAELRRLREAEGREEREAALLAEKMRRAEVEREIQERERGEREMKKEEEKREADEERQRRERVVDRVRKDVERCGACDLTAAAWEEGKDRLWAERLVRASGILERQSRTTAPDADASYKMVTGGGWVVHVDPQLVRDAYADAVSYGESNAGKVSFAELGTILEKAVRARLQSL